MNCGRPHHTGYKDYKYSKQAADITRTAVHCGLSYAAAACLHHNTEHVHPPSTNSNNAATQSLQSNNILSKQLLSHVSQSTALQKPSQLVPQLPLNKSSSINKASQLHSNKETAQTNDASTQVSLNDLLLCDPFSLMKDLIDLLVAKLKEILPNSIETNSMLRTVNNEINNMVQNTPSTTVQMNHSTDLILPKNNTVDKIVSAQQPSNIPKIAVKSLSPGSSISNTTATLSCSLISVHLNNVNKDVTHCSTRSSNKSTKVKNTSKQTVPNPPKIVNSVSNTEHIAA